MPSHRYDLSRNGSVSIAVRVPRELARQLSEAATASGLDVSTYMRDAHFAAPSLTATIAMEIRMDAVAEERQHAESALQSLRDQIARVLNESAMANERVVVLERELYQPPVRLLVLSGRVLRCEIDARQEFAEAWGQLGAGAQTLLVPVVLMAIREFLLALPETTAACDDLAIHRRLLDDVGWIVNCLREALDGDTRPGAEGSPTTPATVSAGASPLCGAGATEDATTGDGTAPSSPAYPPGSQVEARYGGLGVIGHGVVAQAMELNALGVLSAGFAHFAPSDMDSTPAKVVGASVVPETYQASGRDGIGAPTRTTSSEGSDTRRAEAAEIGGRAHADSDLAPQPAPPQEPRVKTGRERTMSPSEASADMWFDS